MKTFKLARLRKRWRHILFGYLGKILVACIGRTCRFHIDGLEVFAETAAKSKCILMLWHNRLVMLAYILTRFTPQFKYAALISDSRDGEVISVLTNSYKNGRSIRVAHNARAAALKTLVNEINKDEGIVIITPDGPRGPPFCAKPGVVLAAQKSAAFVCPISWKANRFWRLPTWDGLFLPKPFSTISVQLGKPFLLTDDLASTRQEGARYLESALQALDTPK